jgi:hypothetical protein
MIRLFLISYLMLYSTDTIHCVPFCLAEGHSAEDTMDCVRTKSFATYMGDKMRNIS